MKEKYESLEELLEDYTPEQVITMFNITYTYLKELIAFRKLDVLESQLTEEDIKKVVDSYSFGRKK